MTAEEWKNVKEVLHEALKIEPAARSSFFVERSVSAEIRREVESLLAVEAEAGNLMKISAVEFFTGCFDEDEEQNQLIGQNLGVYRVVRELGYGGMGAVYLAERADGKFSQRVALKLLKREMNTAALRRRFEQERQILASLEHPNIARLLDAGTTGDKIPYLAMEYVEGLPIDEFCDRREFDLAQRLNLFRKVCAAVNFAHRNLIVHRDLKPSNILVTESGEPKLLDFGISKILSSDFEQDGSATVTRLGVMTTGYASPEQLRGRSVTTATDIYSLGVILYELLSGHRPFEAKEHDIKEIYQAVLEDEPVPPSRMNAERVTSSNAERGTRKAESGAEKQKNIPRSAVRVPHLLRGDLDNIILKALRKEPERRYSSAENFAGDIERHQAGLPVSARPNTFRYRAEKFIRRNQLGVAAVGLISTAIVGGIFSTLRQSRVARSERKKAEKRFSDVRKLANSYLFDVFPEIEHLEGSLKAREKIVKNALEYLDSLSREAGDDLELQRELAKAYEKIGEVQGAVNISNLGDINSGLESYQKAQRLREAVFRAAPHNPEIKEDVAKNYHVIAQTLMWNIDTGSAEEYFEKAIRLRRALVAENAGSIVLQNRLAVLLSDFSSIYIFNVENEKAFALLDEAAAILRKILKHHPDHFISQKAYPRVLRAYSRLKANHGDAAGALRDLDLSVRLTDELLREKSDDYTLKRTAWLNDFGYCEVFVAVRDGRRIVESGLKTVDFNLKTLQKEPDESFALFDLAMSYYYIAFGFRLSGEPRRSIEYAGKAFEVMTRLDRVAPETIYYLRGFAIIETEIADALLMLDRTAEALEYLTSARAKMEKVVAADRAVLGFQTELARIYRLLASAFDKKGERKASVKFIDAALEIFSKLGARNNLIFAEKDLPEILRQERAKYAAP
jgi:non-specific serine/threonine protein kinase/serine/threonine-protein kinase